MNKIVLSILLILFPTFAMAEDNIYSLKTRFGLVRVGHDEINEPDRLIYRGKIIFKAKFKFLSMHGSTTNKTRDVILFGTNCGGSGCAPDDLYLLIIDAASKPLIVTANGFQSDDGTMKMFKNDGTVQIDLGFEKGRRKFAVLTSDKITLRYESVHDLPMADEDCKWLYDESAQSCPRVGEYKLPCTNANETSLSGGGGRRLSGLSNHPGYVSAEWHKSCVAWCAGEKIGYDDFKKSVCSMKMQ